MPATRSASAIKQPSIVRYAKPQWRPFPKPRSRLRLRTSRFELHCGCPVKTPETAVLGQARAGETGHRVLNCTADVPSKLQRRRFWGRHGQVRPCTCKVVDEDVGARLDRSEERRVGKECRSRWS